MVRVGIGAIVAWLLVDEATGNSLHVAKLCRGQLCTDPKLPILDYDQEQGSCICRAHPCWHAAENAYECNTPEYPHLRFLYDSERKLHCDCSAVPYISTVYIARDMCPGKHCDQAEFPELDWDPEKGECLCRQNPCIQLDGVVHSCTDGRFPILRYREEQPETPDGEPKRVCECIARLDISRMMSLSEEL